MGLLRILLRALYLLLAAEGGVRERPYFSPLAAKDGEVGEDREKTSERFHSSTALFPRLGEFKGLCGPGEEGDAAGESSSDSERVLWKRGSVERSISVADILKLVSERLPFFRSNALKVSLLVEDLRRLRWMEPAWRGKQAVDPGLIAVDPGLIGVGVAGGEWGLPPARNLSSSDSLRPRTLRFDLGRKTKDQTDAFSESGREALIRLLHVGFQLPPCKEQLLAGSSAVGM